MTTFSYDAQTSMHSVLNLISTLSYLYESCRTSLFMNKLFWITRKASQILQEDFRGLYYKLWKGKESYTLAVTLVRRGIDIELARSKWRATVVDVAGERTPLAVGNTISAITRRTLTETATCHAVRYTSGWRITRGRATYNIQTRKNEVSWYFGQREIASICYLKWHFYQRTFSRLTGAIRTFDVIPFTLAIVRQRIVVVKTFFVRFAIAVR
jgi:hypothetical protein